MRTLYSFILTGTLLATAFCGISMASDTNGGETALSQKGLYKVNYESRVTPIPLNTIHAWVIEVRDTQDKPVTGAEISIDGGMPAHGHGLPTSPRVTEELGDGRYVVDGLKFQMPGEWVIDLSISTDKGTDTARIDLSLGAGSDHSGHHH